MSMYFWAGNFWIFTALVLHLGKHFERSQPTMYSFFGIGGSYYPFAYGFMEFACLALGVGFLVVARKIGQQKNDESNI